MTKSVTIEHPKTFRTLSNTVRQAKTICQVGSAGKSSASSLYGTTTKTENFSDEKKTIKKAKIMKWSHAYRDYTSAFNAEILNSLNSERQLKDSEYAARNKIKH